MVTIIVSAARRPKTCSGAPAFFEKRNQSTSMGDPRSCTTRPDAARTVEPRRSQPIWSSARTLRESSGVATLTPVTRPSVSIRLVTCADVLTCNAGKRRPCSARKLRKYLCGSRATNRYGAEMRSKSATFRQVALIFADNARNSQCGSFRK